jgi:tryptophanyl-tRNA synthetase
VRAASATADIGAYPRIASLTNPLKKMSKSSLDKSSKILLTTPPATIRTTISRALTDSLPGVYSSPDRPGVTNLLNILAAFEGRTTQELESEVREWNMRRFKERVAQSVVDGLKDIQRRYEEVSGDRGWFERVRREGNERAREVASQRISQIKRIVGLL